MVVELDHDQGLRCLYWSQAPSCSDRGDPTVDTQFRSGREPRSIRRVVERRRGYFFWLARTAERAVRRHLPETRNLFRTRAHFQADGSVDGAWGNGVDSDATRSLEFDYAKAIERATRLFWKSGYAGTSLRALLRSMGKSNPLRAVNAR